MNLIHTVTLEYPRSLWQLRQENPNVSFPAEPTDDDLLPFDHANVHATPPPVCDPRTERVEDTLTPQQADDGTWQQAWVVRPATAEEIEQRSAAEAFSVRQTRNALLSQSDWTQLPDATAEAESWAFYRQELRNLPAQAGFPWDVQWPQAPEQ